MPVGGGSIFHKTMLFSLVNSPQNRDHFLILSYSQSNTETSEIIFPKLYSQILFKKKLGILISVLHLEGWWRKPLINLGAYGFNSMALTVTFFFSNRCQPLN